MSCDLSEQLDVSSIPAFMICMKDEEFGELETRLRNSGFSNLERFNGVDGKQKREGVLKALGTNEEKDEDTTGGAEKVDITFASAKSVLYSDYRENHAQLSTLGAVGVYLSHTEIWSKVSTGEDKYKNGAFIFECDSHPADASSAFEHSSSILKAAVAADCKLPDILFLGFFQELYSDPLERIEGVDSVARVVGNVYGMHAYYVSPQGASTLLRFAFPMEQQVDSYISDLIELASQVEKDPDFGGSFPSFHAFASKNELFYQKNKSSSVQTKSMQKCQSPLMHQEWKTHLKTTLFILLIGIVCLFALWWLKSSRHQ